MSIIIKSEREINLMKESGKVLIGLFKVLEEATRPGISTKELDTIAKNYIISFKGIPSTYGYEGYPGNICISVNDTLIHGIPSKSIILKEGDIVTYDCMCTLNGYTTDAARTFPVGQVSKVAQALIETSRKCFFEGVKLIKDGIHLGDVSERIEAVAKENGFSLPEEYSGHGVGVNIHEDPYVPNTGVKNTGPILHKGMTLAIEPMICEGSPKTKVLSDGWTIKTRDGKLCSHYENTVVVTATGYQIITLDEKENI